MEVRKEDFPVVIQAFETNGSTDIFIAEQVVNTQADINTFSSRYAGKIIKARRLTDAGASRLGNHQPAATHRKSQTRSVNPLFVFLIFLALVILGFTTGWIQQTFGIQL